MFVQAPRRSQTIILEKEKNLFQQMLEDRLALAEQARQCAGQSGARNDDQPEARSEPDEDVRPLVLDSKLIGLHLEEMIGALDGTRQRSERTLRRLQQVMVRLEKGQQESLSTLRRNLDALINLEVIPPQPVEGQERAEILQSMREMHGSEIPPEGSVYRLYREDRQTSYFVLSDGLILAMTDGTIGTSEDKEELVALIMSEIYAQEAVFAKGIDEIKESLDGLKRRFFSQISAISTTIKMQQL